MFQFRRPHAVLIAGVLGAILLAGPVAAQNDPAQAQAQPASLLPAPVRLAGADRYEQAVLAAKLGFTRSDTVFVASGEKFPDALSAVSVAAHNHAALLLTSAATLLPAVGDEIAALHPALVVAVGGAASVSDAVLEQLSRRVSGAIVMRIGGTDRYAVSQALIGDPVVGFSSADEVYLANGAGFADALTASPAAASGARVHPLLLVNGAQTAPTAAEDALLGALGTQTVQLAGGPNSLGAALESHYRAAGFAGTRFAGADRFEVGVRLNQHAFSAAQTAYLASGAVFPDALSGGALAAHDKAPLYVVQQNCVPQPVLDDLARIAPTKIVVLGGTATLGPGVDALTPCP